MKKVLVLLLSSGAMAAVGVLALDVAPAMAMNQRNNSTCHTSGGRGGPGTRGNNFECVLTSVGQIASVTVGDFTIADVNNATTNGGCSGITLFGSSNYFESINTLGGSWTSKSGGTSINIDGPFTTNPAGTGTANNLVQAYDATSRISADVGDGTGPALATGVIPCTVLGNVA